MSDYRDAEPISVGIDDACRMIGAGRSVIYQLLGERKIVGLKIGRRTVVSVRSLRDYVATLPPAKIRPPIERRPVGVVK